jgi:AcrR family transcriptional regulator
MTAHGMMRVRLVEVATDLFAADGFEGTNVARIQDRAGLAGGSGALYKHFASKQALFEACVDAAIERNKRRLAAAPANELQTDLASVAASGLRELAAQRQVTRILFRDGDRFPHLRDRFFREVTRPYFAAFAGHLRASGLDDPDATALVLLGSILSYELLQTLFGRVPGRVGIERFAAAWAGVAADGTDRQ